MTTYGRDARTLELPWPFTGREDELELVRRASVAGRQGVVVTGPAGVGKTRLITEAVRGTDCVRVTGTPETGALPFAAFAHLLSDRVSLPGAVRHLSGVRLLVVDDAHLLDEASAALVHQLATQGRTRLVVAANGTAPVPGAVSRLWTGELLTHLALEPLPYDETAVPEQCEPALKAEQEQLEERIEQLDVREVPAPVGEWLAAGDLPVPPGYAAVRARYSWLRGELREAAAWAREGLRAAPGDAACRTELARAAAERGEGAVVRGDGGLAHYGAVRLGDPQGAAAAAARLDGVLGRHAEAVARGAGPALDRAAEALAARGLLLFAAEAHAQAVRAHRDPRAARMSRTRALALARRCQGARTPALSGLVLGELTARQRQIVTLAAAGLSNRQIAEQLTLSVRTVGNHLYSAYTRLGANDRAALPWLVDQPDRRSA